MKLFVTGTTGFVGSTLLLNALRNPSVERIAASVRNPAKLANLLETEGFPSPPPKLQILSGDTSEWNFSKANFSPTACVHCAGTLFSNDPAAYFAGNVEGTRNLLAKLPPSCRTILLSSQSAAGPSPSDPLEESSPCSPISFYGKSKREMELVAQEAFFEKNETVILRPPIILGARDTATLPLFQMAQSPLCFKPGREEKKLSWISVDDLVSAIFAILGADSGKSGIYFVAAQEPTTDLALIRETARSLKKNPTIVRIPKLFLRALGAVSEKIPAIGKAVPSLTPDRCQELLFDSWVVSPALFQKNFSWQASESLFSALCKTRDSYRQRGLLRFSNSPE